MAEYDDVEGRKDWIVVCLGCSRIKRDGVWTNDRATELSGKSTGYCDSCAKAARRERV